MKAGKKNNKTMHATKGLDMLKDSGKMGSQNYIMKFYRVDRKLSDHTNGHKCGRVGAFKQ